MTNVAWEMAYSVETDASPAFAWNYWTNIANWADPPAEFELDGPFAVGSRGVTRLPGREPLRDHPAQGSHYREATGGSSSVVRVAI